MNYRQLFRLPALIVILSVASLAQAQELEKVDPSRAFDGSDLENQLRARQEKINKLSPEELEKLQAAQRKALEDPAVKEAMKRRDEAISEFKAAIRAGLMKADPAALEILQKLHPNPRP